MEQGRLEASAVYAVLARMGLIYGPAHQGISALYLGKKQVLGQLRLPAIIETTHPEYVLHPSLMDSALQASVGLLIDVNHAPGKPYVPFALESLRILSACTREMAAWVRYSKGIRPEDRNIKLDIDLCDHQGNVCVQMRGFASRVLEGAPKPAYKSATNGLVKSNSTEHEPSFDDAFYQKLITDVLNHELSVDEAAGLALTARRQ